jgi:putative SOS response-associated peptidase YedK
VIGDVLRGLKFAKARDLAAFMYKINFLTARKDGPDGIVRKYFEENRYLSNELIVTTEYENRKLAPAKWGLVSNLGEHGRAKYSINAKAETVESRPTFAEAFAHRRCGNSR